MKTPLHCICALLFALCPRLAIAGEEPRNAPGHVDVLEPPEKIEVEGVVIPKNPGKKMLILSVGGLFGFGSHTARGEDGVGVFNMGVEISLGLGRQPAYWDVKKGLFTATHVLQINSGITRSSPNADRMLSGYAEIQWGMIWFGLAGGWALGLKDGDAHGPQITGNLGPIYARFTHLFDHSSQLVFGLLVKLPLIREQQR